MSMLPFLRVKGACRDSHGFEKPVLVVLHHARVTASVLYLGGHQMRFYSYVSRVLFLFCLLFTVLLAACGQTGTAPSSQTVSTPTATPAPAFDDLRGIKRSL